MKNIIFCAAAVAVVLAGCADMTPTQRRAAIGAGSGAVVGAAVTRHHARGALIGAGVGALGGYVWSQHMEKQRQDMEQATHGTGIVVTKTDDNLLRIDIPSDISFPTNEFYIQRNFMPILDRFAQSLRENPSTYVHIVGHTDSTGNDAINDPLSLNRANSTRDYLVSRGVDFDRFYTEGRGSRQPIASNATVEGRARNRRVEIYIGERAGG